MKNTWIWYGLCFALLAALLAVLLVWNLCAGSVDLTLGEIVDALLGAEDAGGIIWDIRLPRLLAAAILGGALSVSGFLLQTFFANPLPAPLCWASPRGPS